MANRANISVQSGTAKAIAEACARIAPNDANLLTNMLAIAGIESGFDPNCTATTSSATGLFQFLKGVWVEDCARFRSEFGVSADLNGRFDPYKSALVFTRYIQRNAAGLGQYAQDPTLLYLSHYFGQGGVKKFINAMQTNPNTLMDNILDPKAIAANANLRGKTAQSIYNEYQSRMQTQARKGKLLLQQASADPSPLQSVGNFFSNAWNKTKTAFSNAWQGTRNFFQGAATQTKSFFQGAAASTSNFGASIGQSLSNSLSMLSNFISQRFGGTKYIWGSTNGGLDCSGFVRKVFADLFHVQLNSLAVDLAPEIAQKFKLPMMRYANGSGLGLGNIPPFAVISYTHGRGRGNHVVMVMPDEDGQPCVWESRGGSANTASNPGKGVTKSSLQSFLTRLRGDGVDIKITDTTSIFSGLSQGMQMNKAMMISAWQASTEEKENTTRQILQSIGLNNQRLQINFTNTLGDFAFLNRSTFIANPENGQPILNVANNMSREWTMYSVITRTAQFNNIEPKAAVLDAAVELAKTGDYSMLNFLNKKELASYGFGPQVVQNAMAGEANGGIERPKEYGTRVEWVSGATGMPANGGGRRASDQFSLSEVNNQYPDERAAAQRDFQANQQPITPGVG